MITTIVKNTLAQVLALESQKELAKNPNSTKGKVEGIIANTVSSIDIGNFSKTNLTKVAAILETAAKAIREQAAAAQV